MKASILVVTVDSDLITNIGDILGQSHIMSTIADSARSAAQWLTGNTPPNIIILDLSLPNDHAMQLLNQMRKQTYLANIPVLVLTADPDPIQIQQAFDAGANRYLTKMFVGKNLLTTVRDMLITE